MELFHPERKRLSGTTTPCFLDFPYVLPGMYVRMLDELKLEVSLWAPATEAAFTYKSVEILVSELPKLISDYYNDPEKTLTEVFKWRPIKVEKRKKEKLTLADLELDQETLSLADLGL